MNSEEAKRILLAWRPDRDDAQAPDVIEALALSERDPDLRVWLKHHRAFQESLRRSFREAPAPLDLAAKILAQHRKTRFLNWRPSVTAWAAAAALALLLGLAAFWMRPAGEDSFATFRSRMVGKVLRQYTMDLTTNDLASIRRHHAAGNGPADYSLPPGLARLPALGAGLLSWQDRKVSMVCLNSTNDGALFLFVVDRASVRQPPERTLEFAPVKQLITASWSEGNRTYVLAMKGRKEDLRKYF
jgi:hypothetical protein